MKINVTCVNCRRVMRVEQEHVGKKGQCPACGVVSLLQPDGQRLEDVQNSGLFEADASFEEISAETVRPHSTANPFQASDPKFPGGSPYQAPVYSGAPRPNVSMVQTDVPGILGVVFGGLSLLGLCLCVCFGPIIVLVVLSSIGGLVLSFFGRPPLKVIGICLNMIALAVCLLLIIGLAAFGLIAINS